MMLAGAHHLTIAPLLLKELADTENQEIHEEFPSLYTDAETEGLSVANKLDFLNNEAAYRLAVTRNSFGENEPKLMQVRRV